MFDKSTEQARRVIFLARYEAGRLGYDSIGAEHFLLGFVRDDQGEWMAVQQEILGTEDWIQPLRERRTPAPPFLSAATAELLRAEFMVPGPLAPAHSTSVDMIINQEGCSALEAAHEHAEGEEVKPLHLLWGLLADRESRVARSLEAAGVTQELVAGAIRDGQ